MRFQGWLLDEWEDRDDDVVKLWQEAIHEDGRRVVLDWSPYKHMSQQVFETFVRLGFPTRSAVGSIGPLNEADLRRLVEEAQERAERQHDAEMNNSDD